MWERRAPNPMLRPELMENAQFRSANLGMLFFAAGAIGSLLLLSLVFLNLWGYEPIEAALAIVPVPLCGLIVWPFVGRAADSRAPGEIAKPALLVMAIGLLWISFLPSTSDNAFSYLRILPGPRDARDRDGDRLPGAERRRDGSRGGADGRASRRACSTPRGSSARRSGWRS